MSALAMNIASGVNSKLLLSLERRLCIEQRHSRSDASCQNESQFEHVMIIFSSFGLSSDAFHAHTDGLIRMSFEPDLSD